MSKPPRSPVPPEADAEFTKCVEHWQDVLGLSDWRIHVSKVRSARKEVMAELWNCDYEQRNATIRLGTDFGGYDVTHDTLNETALHEVLHIFLKELIELARDENTAADVLRSAEHRIINVLELQLAIKRRKRGNTKKL
jgi:hypothetical protein